MSSFVHFLSLLAAVSMATTAVQGACQTCQTFNNPNDLYENVNQCAYPTQKLNLACVSASCPSIASSGKCPLKSDKSIDTTILANQINDCLKTMASACNSGWKPLTMPQMTLGEDLTVLSYTCSTPAADVVLDGLQSTTVSLSAPSPTTLALTLSSPSLTTTSTITCAVKVPPAVTSISAAFTANLKRVYKGSATIDLSATTPTVSQVTTTGSSVTFNAALAPSTRAVIRAVASVLPANLVTAVINSLTSVATSSSDAAPFATYVATYASMVYQLLKAKCPSG